MSTFSYYFYRNVIHYYIWHRYIEDEGFNWDSDQPALNANHLYRCPTCVEMLPSSIIKVNKGC